MICATSCADVIAIAIRCADYQFNHEPGRKNKARGLNYNSGFGSRLTLGLALPSSVIPKRKRGTSPKLMDHTSSFAESLPPCEVPPSEPDWRSLRVSGS